MHASVQMVRMLIGRQLERLAIDREPRIADSAGDAPDYGAEIGMAMQIGLQPLEAENKVQPIAFPHGIKQPGDDASVGDYLDSQAKTGRQRPCLDWFPRGKVAEVSRT
jgi:hypothetical protein